MEPIRFGVLAENPQTADELLGTARRAEAAGCSTLLIRDHLVEGPFRHQLAPLTALAAVAASTTRLRVGTLVLCNDLRHPAVLAKEIATLDVLSGGRVELGLGAGFLRRDYEAAGLPFDEPRDRVGRLEESLRVLKGLFAAGPLTHHGRHYDIDALDSFPKPVQRPHPPLHVAAARPRMLAIAGREADIVNLQGVSTAGGVMSEDPAGRSPAAVAERIERVRAAAGERFAGLELSTIVTLAVTDRPREAAAELARVRGWGLSAEEVLAMPGVLAGPPDRLVELVRERREALGISYFILSDAALDAAAPLLERVARASGAVR
jgi:probable F420-dependent oxidoreductase